MTCEVALSDETAERCADHDGFDDFEGVAEANDVVGPRVEGPLLGGPAVATAVTAVVVEHDLGDVIEDHSVGALVRRMVEAGAAMKQQYRRSFDHRRTVRDQTCAVDVDE